MLRYLLMTAVAAFVLGGCAMADGQGQGGAAHSQERSLLRHVVLFSFKPGTSPEQVKSVEDAFRALPGKIGCIAGFEWGTDVSPEKKAEGFTHCFFLTFHSEVDRDAYLVHPDHKAFGAVLRPYRDKVLVVDYWAKR
jgi:hypothetical protein